MNAVRSYQSMPLLLVYSIRCRCSFSIWTIAAAWTQVSLQYYEQRYLACVYVYCQLNTHRMTHKWNISLFFSLIFNKDSLLICLLIVWSKSAKKNTNSKYDNVWSFILTNYAHNESFSYKQKSNRIQCNAKKRCKLTHSMYSHCVYVLLCLYLDRRFPDFLDTYDALRLWY